MKLLLFVMLAFAVLPAKAQTYVTIPDANFAAWLTANYPTCMNGNQLDITCADITTATLVDVNSQSISDLTGIEHFTALTSLICWSNQLAFLPPLPPDLTMLQCDGNALTSLPVLPANLQVLVCTNNNLTSLPALPASLTTLYCAINSISALPALPFFMETLDCSNNLLTSLPILPGSLTTLHCSYNSLTSLPDLPGGLSVFYCNHNNLTRLPALPAFLNNLECQHNALTSLPTMPASVRYLNADSNHIVCMPVFSNNLVSISIAENAFKCLPNYVNAMDQQTKAYPLCLDGDNVNNPYACNESGSASGISGYTYKDANTDCIKNNGDNQISNVLLKLFDNNNNYLGQTYSAQNGYYQFVVPPGNYTVKREVNGKPYTFQCVNPGLSSAHTLTNLNRQDVNANFDVSCLPGFDIGVQSVSRNGLVFPGQQHVLRVVAGNVNQWNNLTCGAAVSGLVVITVNGPVAYEGKTSGALTPSVSGNVFTFNIANFNNIDIKQAFGLLFRTNNNAQAGQQICVSVSVSFLNGDYNVLNNNYQFCYNVVNSYDPNIKEVYPQKVMPGYNDWLVYNIQFQNTGNAPAFNIRVADTLSDKVDSTTFELLNYSHFNRTTLMGKALNFSFPDIMLADSTTDEPASHGFITYRVKMKPGLPAGSKINNRAFIYFDYNPPVITNTATLSIENPCDGVNTVITSNIAGSTFQWQVDKGNGYTDILNDADYAGGNTAILNLFNPTTTWSGYNYRCVTDSGTTAITTLKFVQYWKGISDNKWENPLNWSCGKVPDGNTDVVIPGSNSPFFMNPTVNSNSVCRSLTLTTGAKCEVNTGFSLTVLH